MSKAVHRLSPAWLLFLILQCGLLLTAMSTPAHAEAIAGAEAKEVETAIQRQFDAFQRDDAVAAFAMASKGIRAQFGTAEKFMAVVKQQYKPVYRHRRVLFTGTERINGEVMQTVRLTDADDRVWVAVYRMERETDGQWRIVGCELVETKSIAT